jgi:integrase/recombinase XerD
VRLSPHTFRHTFAIEFLRNGGNQFTLMALLGHTDVKMTQRSVTYAQADIAAQHRINSPVDRMRRHD